MDVVVGSYHAHVRLSEAVVGPSRGVRGHAPREKILYILHWNALIWCTLWCNLVHFQCANWTNKKSQWQSKKGLEPLLVSVPCSSLTHATPLHWVFWTPILGPFQCLGPMQYVLLFKTQISINIKEGILFNNLGLHGICRIFKIKFKAFVFYLFLRSAEIKCLWYERDRVMSSNIKSWFTAQIQGFTTKKKVYKMINITFQPLNHFFIIFYLQLCVFAA